MLLLGPCNYLRRFTWSLYNSSRDPPFETPQEMKAVDKSSYCHGHQHRHHTVYYLHYVPPSSTLLFWQWLLSTLLISPSFADENEEVAQQPDAEEVDAAEDQFDLLPAYLQQKKEGSSKVNNILIHHSALCRKNCKSAYHESTCVMYTKEPQPSYFSNFKLEGLELHHSRGRRTTHHS